MKRSEINRIINEGRAFFDKNNFYLPEWGYWSPEEWKLRKMELYSEVFEHNLGWDITDFGSGDFTKRGLVLFTIRNGSSANKGKTYCEKIMIVEEEQETPLHYHWHKTEDIINRGGGNLVMELFASNNDGEVTKDNVTVSIDGGLKELKPGEKLFLSPGQSICLTPGLYHRFYGESGSGKVLTGEVSTVNDDAHDNRFYQEIGRFPDIEEDEAPVHFLVSDYSRFL